MEAKMDIEGAVGAPSPQRAAGRLTGRAALVIGAGTKRADWPGTGSATAQLLAAAGARVAVVGRTSETVQRTVDLIREAGGEAIALVGDATVEADVARFVSEVKRAFGRLDILVNNVGEAFSGGVSDLPLQDWEASLRTNLTLGLLAMRHARELLCGSEQPSIVNVGSVAGLRAGGGIAYGTAKGALEAMTRECALDLGSDGIRVNLVVPGHLHTVSGAQFQDDGARELRRQLSMHGREGTAWDIAWAVLFLAGSESRFVTAATLVIDGGAAQTLPLRAVANDRRRRA